MSNKRIRKKQSKLRLCALCGKPLPREHDHRVVGQTGQSVCLYCLTVSRRILAKPESECEKPITATTPRQLIAQLDRSIIGQDQAKRAVSIALWKQMLRVKGVDLPNPGLLLYGPTGCGKTALAREAARAAGLPFIVFDSTTLTEAGYKGNSAEDIIKTLKNSYPGQDVSKAVIFLDEIDKLAARGSETRQQYSRGTQHSLLKLIEGSDVEGISTQRMLFLFSGAFTGIGTTEKVCRTIGFNRPEECAETCNELQPSDFIAYGMEPELMGRICRCVPISPLTEEDLRRILLESNLSHFRKYQTFFQSHNRECLLSEEEQNALIQEALSRGLGARGLNALVEEWAEEKLIELSESMQ